MNIKVIVASILLTLSLSACSPSPDDINDTVKESLQETLSTDTDFANYNLRVGNIDLIKVNDSQYKALAEVYLDDELHTVPLICLNIMPFGKHSQVPFCSLLKRKLMRL